MNLEDLSFYADRMGHDVGCLLCLASIAPSLQVLLGNPLGLRLATVSDNYELEEVLRLAGFEEGKRKTAMPSHVFKVGEI